MKFKKAVLAPASLLLVAASVACGGIKGGEYVTHILTPTPDKPSGKVVFWSNVYGDSETAWAADVVTEFNKIYPDIEVEILGKGKYDKINSEVQKTLATPELLPNLVVGYPDYFQTYFNKLVNMEDYIRDADIGLGKIHTTDAENKTTITADEKTKYDDFVSKYIEEGKSYPKEGIYSLPFGKTTEIFFYNETVFSDPANGLKVPTTWGEAMEAGRTFKAAHPERYESATKTGQLAPLIFHSTSNMFITLSEMTGTPYASSVDKNNDGKVTKSEAVLFNNDKAKKLVKTLKGWFDEGLFTTVDISKEQGGQEYAENNFVMKDPATIMLYDSTKGTKYVANSINKVQEAGEEWEYAGSNEVAAASRILAADASVGGNGSTKAINQGGSIAMFDKGEEANKCAWLFYKFMTNSDFATKYTLANSTTPSRKSVFEREEVKTIIGKKDNAVSKDSTWVEHFERLNGQVFDLYNDYAENDLYYAAPVNAFSAKQRQAIEQMIVQIMITTTDGSDAAIDNLIETEFTKAYNAI